MMIEQYQQQLVQLRSTDEICTKDWLDGLHVEALAERDMRVADVEACFGDAQERCFWQLLRAMVREGFWQSPDSLKRDGNDLLVNLSPDSRLRLINADGPRWGLFTRADAVQLQTANEIGPVNHPAGLLALLLVGGMADEAAVTRFYAELQNSMLNDALFLAWRKVWQQQLVKLQGQGDFWQWCRGASNDANISLLLEQWATVGHPVHPAVKCKQGMTATEVLQMAPEFCGQIEARLAAVRSEILHVEMLQARNYRAWFQSHFADWYQKWSEQLQAAGADVDQFLPLPVHPWQVERTLGELFADHIAAGEICLLQDGPTLSGGSTMSFRTIVPQDRCDVPHIKLPIAMRLTSGQRIVSTRSCEMGPRFSRFLQQRIEHHPVLAQYLQVMNESAGVHYQADREKEDRIGKHLSVLYRDNPMALVADDEVAVPVAALLVACPERPNSLFSLMAEQQSLPLMEQFTRYLQVVLKPVLALYLRYGIAIEAHQQNSFAVFSREGEPRRLLARDFGAFRVYAPVFERSGAELEFHHDRSLISDDPSPARNKLLHAVFICHIAELINQLCREQQLEDTPFWEAVRREVEACFAQWQNDSDNDWWQQERKALLENDWCMKLFTRMRLADSGEDMYHHFRNPLATCD